ncbi:stalk domain-containing protein [Paenibacillus sp. NFR01]|uniref:stalk domain-containing protein n=1 Tax=Paenibacillus sp. NFR01 TaxID=1566279 RepID=UPI0008D59052|nr:stalk domain-containing protein [Paenibacillus sp. NFR01]SET58304.1 Copper amine oxidase N-terminal domain-containing protein [Paenibacillus sp. NFR01]
MNWKKLTLAAVLAVSQAAAAVPVFAESATGTNVTGSVYGSNTPDVTGSGAAAPAATPDPNAASSLNNPQATPVTAVQSVYSAGGNQLILMMNSNKMYVNGVPYLANQPMAVKNGVSYVSIRAMVERVGVKYIYDAKTKEVVVTSGSNVMRFKTDSKIYTVNGKPTTMKGPAYQYKGTFMIPLTSITAALNIPYTVDNVQKRVILTLNTKPSASFTIQPTEIYAGQTYVTFTPSSSSPSGTPIVDERWEGKQDIYTEPGLYTVTYSVMDANGQWSNPYAMSFQVLKPNQPPVANFTTDKDEYQMGEPITLTDLSYDPEGEALTAEWTNRALAFFNPGPVSIQLKVTDKHGLSSTFEKTINITSQQMYTREEVERLFTPPGDVISMDGGSIPALPNLNYATSSEPYMLIRSNSPETVNQEGILYRESAVGATRFLIHHMNNMSTRQKLYLIATNNNIYPTTITTQYAGIAGPASSPEYTGKISIQKYYNSMLNNSAYGNIVLQPGESKAIFTDLNSIAMKPGEVLSLSADVYSDLNVQYNVVMVEQSKDPIALLPTLPLLDRDGVHNRGTYPNSTRTITVSDVVGTSQSKLILGDNRNDPNLMGFDTTVNSEASNSGNFGVLYKIKLEHVAANTLITFNPRGGNYLGSVLVNQSTIVNLPNSGSLTKNDMNAVVYRTGNYDGPVELTFAVASGSNLPVNFVFTPLPPKRN